MPTNPVAPKTKAPSPKAKGGGGGGLASKKIGGIPVVVLAGGVVLAIAVGLYFRHKSAGSSAASGSPAATDPGLAGPTGGASESGTGADQSALADAINGLTYYLGGGGGVLPTTDAGSLSGTTTTSAVSGIPTGFSGNLGSDNPKDNAAVATAWQTRQAAVNQATLATTSVSHAIPAATDNFAEAAVRKSNAYAAAGAAQPFGGVRSTVMNQKTGVTTTTYNSGRIVQQAPGKSAYVAKK